MRAINTSEVSYSAACGNGAYAISFVNLGTPPPGGYQAFLSNDLTGAVSPQKSGFTYTLGWAQALRLGRTTAKARRPT